MVKAGSVNQIAILPQAGKSPEQHAIDVEDAACTGG